MYFRETPTGEVRQKIGDYPPDHEADLVDDAPERLVTLLFKKYREQENG